MIEETPIQTENEKQNADNLTPNASTTANLQTTPSTTSTNTSKMKKQRRKSAKIKTENTENPKETDKKDGENTATKTEDIENIPPLNPEILNLKNNLKNYLNELKNLLSEGLDHYQLSYPDNFLENIKQEFFEADNEEKLKFLLEKLLAPIIDSKPFNKLSELVLTCKEYVNSVTDKFADWDEDKFMNFIMSISERKNYLDRMKIPFSPEEFNNHQFYIFEVKNLEILTFFADMVEVTNARRKRVHKMKIVEALYRLIQNIEKTKTNEDLEKTNKALDYYYKKKQETVKLLENKTGVSGKKRKNPVQTTETTEKKDKNVNKSLKKLKIESDKESFLDAKEIKENSEIDPQNGNTEDPAKEENDKAKKKSNNQKSLLSFFAKKSPRKSDIKPQVKEKEEKRALFRCVGFLTQNPYQIKIQNNSELFQESFPRTIGSAQIEEREILFNLKQETLRNKKMQRKRGINSPTRKIFLFLYDSLKKYNGISCDLVGKRVKGRKPWEKEDCINYDVDSDEELEEQNATDISSDEKEIDEEDENDSEDDDEKFVVPDGYLSQEEKIDEDGEVETNMAPLDLRVYSNNGSNKAFLLCFDKYQTGKDSNLDDFVENFRVFSITAEEFPISVRKKKFENNLKGEELWNNQEVLKAFIRVLHGSFENKPNIVNDFFAKNPLLTKASIDRKIKEISKKDKIEGQSRACYVVNKELFETLKIEDEYDKILNEKFEINAKKEAENKKNLIEEKEEEEKKDLKKNNMQIEEERTTIPNNKQKSATTPLKPDSEMNASNATSNSKPQKNILSYLKVVKPVGENSGKKI